MAENKNVYQSDQKRKGIFKSTENVVVNVFDAGSEASGLIVDSMVLAREVMQPSIIDARVDTAESLVRGVNKLVELGMEGFMTPEGVNTMPTIYISNRNLPIRYLYF